MDGNIITSLKDQFNDQFVVFRLSERMLKNHEFNATQEIRFFLKEFEIFDYDKLESASKKYIDCLIVFNDVAVPSTIRCGFPPNKREARMWIYNLQKFVESGDEVLVGVLGHKLVVVPINEKNDLKVEITEVIETIKLSDESIKHINDQKEDEGFKAFKTDYIEKAKRNKEIGLAGEIFILNLEKQKLREKELIDLAGKVNHKSISEGDGLGYDILSYDENENEIFIEVKTTTGVLETPIYLTEREILLSSDNPSKYKLYRVYEFDEKENKGKVKIITGDLKEELELNSISYKAVIT